jgi:formylglycine-generating enzyme required for sulfatase activity
MEETVLKSGSEQPSGPTPVRFSSNAPVTRTTLGGTEWVQGDSIGIYMVKNGDAIGINLANNRKHTVFHTPGGGLPGQPDIITPDGDGNRIYWQGGIDMNFIAYYPYRPLITSYTYPIDVRIQDNDSLIDVLYVRDNTTPMNVGTHGGPGQTVDLVFEHVMSKVIINVTTDNSTTNSDVVIDGMKTFAYNSPLTANLNLNDGALAISGQPGIIEMKGIAKAASFDTAYQAIIIPHKVDNASTGNEYFQFQTIRRFYNLELTDQFLFEPGYVYTFDVTLEGESSVKFTATVKSWTEWQPQNPGDDEATVGQDNTGALSRKVIAGGLDTLTLAYVRASSVFNIGTNKAKHANGMLSTPIHQVQLASSFRMTSTEITNAQYCLFLNTAAGVTKDGNNAKLDVNAIAPEVPAGSRILMATGKGISYTNNLWTPDAGKNNFPAQNITWYGAIAYAKWAGGDLPTEAQWELAARGDIPDDKDFISPSPSYDGSNMITAYAVSGSVAAVGSKTAFKGLYDMFGNVYEWCYDRVPDNTSGYIGILPGQCVNDPLGNEPITDNTYAIMRGGSFSANTDVTGNSNTSYWIGQRYARQLKQVAEWAGFRVVFSVH